MDVQAGPAGNGKLPRPDRAPRGRPPRAAPPGEPSLTTCPDGNCEIARQAIAACRACLEKCRGQCNSPIPGSDSGGASRGRD